MTSALLGFKALSSLSGRVAKAASLPLKRSTSPSRGGQPFADHVRRIAPSDAYILGIWL